MSNVSYKTTITINQFIEMRKEYEQSQLKKEQLANDALKLAGIKRTVPPMCDYIILQSKINE